MAVLKLTAVGTSTEVVIPKEMLGRLNVQKGDRLHATETKDGYMLTPYSAEAQRQLEIGREFMKEFREAFRALAK